MDFVIKIIYLKYRLKLPSQQAGIINKAYIKYSDSIFFVSLYPRKNSF